MSEALVQSSVSDGIGTIVLANPSKRNALSQAMLEALSQAFATMADDSNVRVIVLRAEGPVFSAGHDLKELVSGDAVEHEKLFTLCSQVMERIRHQPQPVIAMVHGLATAAGCQLVATCDLAVAAENAAFATPGVKIGLFCTTPAVALSRAVLPKKAMEMLLTGAPISAAEAERVGLVNRVVSAELLDQTTLALARQIAAASAETLKIGKKAFYRQLPLDYPEAYEVAGKVMTDNAGIYDAKEGMKAFLEKRPAVWKRDCRETIK